MKLVHGRQATAIDFVIDAWPGRSVRPTLGQVGPDRLASPHGRRRQQGGSFGSRLFGSSPFAEGRRWPKTIPWSNGLSRRSGSSSVKPSRVPAPVISLPPGGPWAASESVRSPFDLPRHAACRRSILAFILSPPRDHPPGVPRRDPSSAATETRSVLTPTHQSSLSRAVVDLGSQQT
jgi:hypothetical protein